jgi:hypothetical protein
MRRLQIQTFIDLIFLWYRWEPIITSGLLPLFPSRPPLLCRVLNVVGDPQPLLLFLRPTFLLPRSPRWQYLRWSVGLELVFMELSVMCVAQVTSFGN